MKTRIIMITTVLAMGCLVWLLGENRAYKAQYEKQQVKEAELIDRIFDLQSEYDMLLDEALRLENETQILGSMIDEMEVYIEENND